MSTNTLFFSYSFIIIPKNYWRLCHVIVNILFFFLVLFLNFHRKTILIKWASVCACGCACVWVGRQAGVHAYVCLHMILDPPNNFQTTYPIDTKFGLHIVSYWNSQTPLIQFLNFENCARENFLKFIFSPFN